MPSTPRVLVVDDEEVIATTLSMILNTSGFDSVASFSGTKALEIATASHFDILVTDVMMEPMNGIELALAFLDIHPAARVFLISGATDASRLIVDGERSGHSFPLLPKPLHPRTLIDQLRT